MNGIGNCKVLEDIYLGFWKSGLGNDPSNL